MTDHTFILILKALFKRYFENGESVGLEVRNIVTKYRQEIEDDIINFKYSEKNEDSKRTFRKRKKSARG